MISLSQYFVFFVDEFFRPYWCIPELWEPEPAGADAKHTDQDNFPAVQYSPVSNDKAKKMAGKPSLPGSCVAPIVGKRYPDNWARNQILSGY